MFKWIYRKIFGLSRPRRKKPCTTLVPEQTFQLAFCPKDCAEEMYLLGGQFAYDPDLRSLLERRPPQPSFSINRLLGPAYAMQQFYTTFGSLENLADRSFTVRVNGVKHKFTRPILTSVGYGVHTSGIEINEHIRGYYFCEEVEDEPARSAAV